ncbi:subtilisin [Melghirimyces profundicolus]|uniref:Subtilisin n=1 Tax=Melghirimyces profundicolus TaxID=1242148 RepID=A0A2T6C7R0_9BACL|nr:S8 family serine peptidase [Melghirimyces profundicolus]PTX64361.1 subtilisin [Melghirimyces profundicolus]
MKAKNFKLLGSVLLSCSLVFTAFSPGAGASAADSSSPEKFRVLIQADKEDKRELKQKYGERWDFGKKGFTTDVNQKQYEGLKNRKDLEIRKVQKAKTVGTVKAEATRSATPSDQTPWGIEAIYNISSIPSTSGGSGTRVAVLDTGTYIDHADLAGNAEQCKDFTSGRGMKNGACTDKNGHGTHVAGTVLADGGSDGLGIYGVAPDAKLWAYKVLGNSGFGWSDDIANAIRHAADEGNRLGVNVVISMSLGSSSKDSLIADAVTYAYNNGALVVAAAGNDGPDPDTIGYPGALANAVAVAALEDVQENGTYRVADFSSRGNPDTVGDDVIQERDVEVSAPGRTIESTWKDGGYNTISGTSMATPHISGLAAKIWAANPSWNNHQLRDELQNRAKTNDIQGGLDAGSGDDIASGFGFPLAQ